MLRVSFEGSVLSGRTALLLFLAALPLASIPAQAQTTANSSAFGESIQLNLVPWLGGGLHVANGPWPQVSGTAPAVYAKNANAVSAQVSALLLGQILQTRVLDVNASASLTSGNQSRASATVNDAGLRLGGAFSPLNLNAAVLRTSAAISGTCGSFAAAGSTDIANATVGGNFGVSPPVSIHPAPNTVLLNLAGIKVILNEQLVGGDGTTSRSLTVNAVHVRLQNSLLSGLGLLSGDIVIAQSQAAAQCAGPKLTADLQITGSGDPATVSRDAALTYTFTVTNNGPDDAATTVLTDPLPAGFTLSTVSSDQGSCTATGQTVSCNLGTVATGQSVQVQISGSMTTTGTLVDTGSVLSAGAADPDLSNNSVTITTLVVGGS